MGNQTLNVKNVQLKDADLVQQLQILVTQTLAFLVMFITLTHQLERESVNLAHQDVMSVQLLTCLHAHHVQLVITLKLTIQESIDALLVFRIVKNVQVQKSVQNA